MALILILVETVALYHDAEEKDKRSVKPAKAAVTCRKTSAANQVLPRDFTSCISSSGRGVRTIGCS